MTALDDICAALVADIGGARAAAIADLQARRVLAVHQVESFEAYDAEFAALFALLLGRAWSTLEDGPTGAGPRRLQLVSATSVRLCETCASGRMAVGVIATQGSVIAPSWTRIAAAVAACEAGTR